MKKDKSRLKQNLLITRTCEKYFLRFRGARVETALMLMPSVPRFPHWLRLSVFVCDGLCPPQISAIEKVNVRYTSLSKHDIEALQATYQGTEIVYT